MTAAIETRGLSKNYGPVRAVTGLNLVVEPGQVFAFLGPNGAGKTTTIRMLLALQRQTSGTAEVLGPDSGRDSVEIHRRTGYLPGELALYPRMTGRQHIAWYARARGLRDLSLARTLAERLGAVLDRPAGELSKGNKQKVGLVLAFMSRPDLLILDEPTSGLDPLTRSEFARTGGLFCERAVTLCLVHGPCRAYAQRVPAIPVNVDPAISEALRGVYDPCCRDKGISVVDMGLLHRASIADGVAHVDLLLTTGWCPFASQVLTDIEYVVARLPSVERAEVRVVWDEAWSPERLSADARRKLRFLPPPAEVADRASFVAAQRPGSSRPAHSDTGSLNTGPLNTGSLNTGSLNRGDRHDR